MKALIIEDDPETVESVSLALRMRWPDAHLSSAYLGKKGLELAETENPDVIILELALPDMSGLAVLKQLRLFSSVPIIVIAAGAEEADIVKALEWGANDCIAKPCGYLEILARVRARVGDRSHSGDGLPISCGALSFEPKTSRLMYGKKQINLTPIETRIVEHLMRNTGRVVTYSSLAAVTWGDDYPGLVESLRVHVRRLREKVEKDPKHPGFILTRRGVGYLVPGPA